MKNPLLYVTILVLTGCANNPNIPLSQTNIDNFFIMQSNLENLAKNDLSFGKKPSNILEIGKKYYHKELIIFTSPKAYKSEKTAINGYITCFKDKSGKLESFFTHDDTIVNSTIESPITRLRENSDCEKYSSFENYMNKNSSLVLNNNNTVENKLINKNVFIPLAIESNSKISRDSNSIIQTVKSFESIETEPKDEFVKSSIYENKLNELLSKKYRFITDKNKILGKDSFELKYNADSEILNININIDKESFILSESEIKNYNSLPYLNLEYKSSKTEYIGQNAFGVKANVSSTILEQYGLAFNNINIENKNSIFKFSIPMSSNEARTLKDSLEFYIDIIPIKSQYYKTTVLRSVGGHGATINNPKEFYSSKKVLLSNVIEIGLINKNTLQVLAFKKYN